MEQIHDKGIQRKNLRDPVRNSWRFSHANSSSRLVIQDHRMPRQERTLTVNRVSMSMVNPARTSADSPVRALRSDQRFKQREIDAQRRARSPSVLVFGGGQIFHFPNALETIQALLITV